MRGGKKERGSNILELDTLIALTVADKRMVVPLMNPGFPKSE